MARARIEHTMIVDETAVRRLAATSLRLYVSSGRIWLLVLTLALVFWPPVILVGVAAVPWAVVGLLLMLLSPLWVLLRDRRAFRRRLRGVRLGTGFGESGFVVGVPGLRTLCGYDTVMAVRRHGDVVALTFRGGEQTVLPDELVPADAFARLSEGVRPRA